MGGPIPSENSLMESFPNSIDVIQPEDDLIITLRLLEPEATVQKFMLPVWKIMSSHGDYLDFEKIYKERVEKTYTDIKISILPFTSVAENINIKQLRQAESIFKDITIKAAGVCDILDQHKSYLQKIFAQIATVKTLYYSRLKHILEEIVSTEEELPEHLMPFISGQDQEDDELLVYSLKKDVDCLMRGLRFLHCVQRTVKAHLVESYSSLSMWQENFMRINTQCDLILKLYSVRVYKRQLEIKSSIRESCNITETDSNNEK